MRSPDNYNWFSWHTSLFVLFTAICLGLLAATYVVAGGGNFVWAKAMGGNSRVSANGITVDAAGNVYITGTFLDTADFDPGSGVFNLTSNGGADIFISKLDSNGNFVWAKAVGGNESDGGNSIAVDSSGNVYTTGYFRDTVNFQANMSLSLSDNILSASFGSDIFISKHDNNGSLVWVKAIKGSTDNDMGNSIAVDSSGNVYTTGFFAGTVDFNPKPGFLYFFNLTSSGDSRDIFISKLNSEGNFEWAKGMGGGDRDFGMGIVVDTSGNVITTGSFRGPAVVEPAPNYSTLHSAGAGTSDVFINKRDSNGNFIWAVAMGGNDWDAGKSIAVDTSGNIYSTGYFIGVADFDPGVGTYLLTAEGGDVDDIFINKLDGNGNFVWAKAIGGINDDEGIGIAVDQSANVYTTGYFYEDGDFDPGPKVFTLSSKNSTNDIFISKLDSNGNFVWAKSMGGGDSNDEGMGVAVDTSGNVYTTGAFSNTGDFDPGSGVFNLTSAPNKGTFVSKLSGPFFWPMYLPAITNSH